MLRLSSMQSFCGVLEHWSTGKTFKTQKNSSSDFTPLHYSTTPLFQCYRNFYYTDIYIKKNNFLIAGRKSSELKEEVGEIVKSVEAVKTVEIAKTVQAVEVVYPRSQKSEIRDQLST
jgi:hypothetical protein